MRFESVKEAMYFAFQGCEDNRGEFRSKEGAEAHLEEKKMIELIHRQRVNVKERQ